MGGNSEYVLRETEIASCGRLMGKLSLCRSRWNRVHLPGSLQQLTPTEKPTEERWPQIEMLFSCSSDSALSRITFWNLLPVATVSL